MPQPAQGPAQPWPSSAAAVMIMSVRIRDCGVDALFSDMFEKAELTECVHRLRGDTELVQSPWRDERPPGAHPHHHHHHHHVQAAVGGTAAPHSARLHSWRQVSFASAPAGPLASQPFRNREQQHVAAHRPGRLYEVQLQANTTAPYGDQFDVLLRLRLLDDPTSSSSSSSFSGGSSSGGSASSLLHVAMAVRWRPTMMPLMKAVIAGAIEGGVRGSYRHWRACLGARHAVEDVPEELVAAAAQAALRGAAQHQQQQQEHSAGEAWAEPGALARTLEDGRAGPHTRAAAQAHHSGGHLRPAKRGPLPAARHMPHRVAGVQRLRPPCALFARF